MPKEGSESNRSYPAIMVNIDHPGYFAPIPFLIPSFSVPMNSAQDSVFSSPSLPQREQQQQQLLLFFLFNNNFKYI
jgi:hypothetical protein